MKNKLVLWGTDAQNAKVLIAMELRPEANKVDIYTFPMALATEEFTKQLMEEWRNDTAAVSFPEGYKLIERELMAADSLLPEDLKVDRSEIIQRAQNEWHFTVLSSKLNQSYRSELEDFKDRIEKMTEYSAGSWEEVKGFWDKVQGQVRDRNLFREHADLLRDGINDLFNKLKDLRTSLNKEFESRSQEHHDKFMAAFDQVQTRAKDHSIRVNVLFDELKELQKQSRDLGMTRDHRNAVWTRVDALFKSIKESRFGAQAADTGNTAADRAQSRLNGLNLAIEKMQNSVDRDQEELDFQNKKIAVSEGQLEAQIRQAKLRMVQERLVSKQEKLNEMIATRSEVEKSLEGIKERDAKRAEKNQAIVATAKAAEAAIVAEATVVVAPEAVVETTVEAIVVDVTPEPIAEVVAKVAEPKTEAIVETVAAVVPIAETVVEVAPTADKELSFSEQLEDVTEDTVDTVKAVAEVLGNKLEDFIESITATNTEDTKA